MQLYGKTLFAGWTKTLPLLPKPCKLPPSAITLEGYGNVVTGTFTEFLPSGVRSKTEFNGFEAFVTFIHKTAKYSGPGTEGFIIREAAIGNA